nr:hypothetical protein [Caulobacter sp. S45]
MRRDFVVLSQVAHRLHELSTGAWRQDSGTAHGRVLAITPDRVVHVTLDLFNSEEAVTLSLRQRVVERFDERRASRFLTLEQAHTSSDDLRHVAEAAGSDRVFGEALELRGKRQTVHCSIIGQGSGAVFRGIIRHGTMEERLTPRSLRLIPMTRAALAKLTVHESERLSQHGLRAGFITEAYLAGALDEQVGAHVRHDDLRSTRGYRRRARITEDNPPACWTFEADGALRTSSADRRGRAGGLVARAAAATLEARRPDWLLNVLIVSGPAEEVARFRAAARRTGASPELSISTPRKPGYSRPWLRAVRRRTYWRGDYGKSWRRHDKILTHWAERGRCLLNLHRLIPIPGHILQLGEDDPSAEGWMRTHWGITRILRAVHLGGVRSPPPP